MKLQKETKAPNSAHGRWYDDACGSALGMELLGERWTLLILRELMFGPRRFSDLRVELPGISAKVLTERLAGMRSNDILRRITLSEPAPAQVYELTPWGRSAETILQEMGRWAVASPLHDPTLPLSSASFMMSLRTMLDHEAAKGIAMTIGFQIGKARFTGRLVASELDVVRGWPDHADLRFRTQGAPQLAAVFYGGVPPDIAGVEVHGTDRDLEQFTGLFNLPQKMMADGDRKTPS